MTTKTGILRPIVQSVDYRKYEFDRRRFNLQIADLVTPETIIGWHYKSGQPVKVNFYGYIATIYFNPMHDSLMVMIQDATSELYENANTRNNERNMEDIYNIKAA
jgi:hypothetical protein